MQDDLVEKDLLLNQSEINNLSNAVQEKDQKDEEIGCQELISIEEESNAKKARLLNSSEW